MTDHSRAATAGTAASAGRRGDAVAHGRRHGMRAAARRRILPLLLGATLGATAPAASAAPDAAALAALQAQDARVVTIGWRLATANLALCRDQAPQAGIVLYDAALYAPAVRATAAALFGLSGAATVGAVAPASAAARAGLATGDAIEAIDGVPLAVEPPGRAASFAGVERTRALLDAAAARGEIALVLRRGASTRTVRFTADRGCASFIELTPSSRRNAGADGHTVSVTTAIADAARDDDELAIVIAHEFAHNILHHRLRLDEEKVARGLFAGLGANGAKLRAIEDEADRVGLYLAARAGYDPAAGARFWSRFGKANDPIVSDGTHSAWRTRVAKLAAVAAEIADKRAAGEPRTP